MLGLYLTAWAVTSNATREGILAAGHPRHIIVPMSRLKAYSVTEIAADLEEPFSMSDVVYVDDLLVSVYLCEGTLRWHRHVDIDELFWVYEGAIVLESERGNTRLEAGALTVVPKGTRHRSRSSGRAIVLLMRCGLVPHRKNGRRHLYATDDTGLPRVNIRAAGDTLDSPFRFQTVAQVEDSKVQLARGGGRWPIELPGAHDRMLYVVDGSLTVRTVRDRLTLTPGQFTVVPRGAFYHLYTSERALLVRVTRKAL